MQAFIGVIVLVLGGHIYGTDSALFPTEENCRAALAISVGHGKETGVIKPGSVVTTACVKIPVATEDSAKKPPSTEL